MRKVLKLKSALLVLLLSLSAVMSAEPQGGIVVNGKVIDETYKEGVPGAGVMIKGTQTGVVTNLDGMFSITVPDEQSVLLVSCVGYAAQEMTVGGRTTINVVLKEENQSLDEVVFVAYGNQNKGLVTSAISSISNEQLVKSPVASVTNMLAGSVPGVSSVQTTGQPGKDAATIYVRGSGTLTDAAAAPLVLVDGIEREFSQIDPNEIESISILKDASSTAVFGVRGANGVILVTTRRGATGAPVISVSSSVGLQQPISLVEQTGSYEYAKFWNVKKGLDGVTDSKQLFSREQVEAYRTGSDPIMYPSMDWQDYIFSDVFVQNKDNINISGGSEDIKYFVSMGYLYQNGLLKQLPGQTYDNNYRYNRYNYRANIDAKLTKTTTMKLGIGGYVGNSQEPRSVVSGSGEENEWVIAQIWSHPFAGPGFVDGVRTVVPKDLVPLGEVLRDGMFIFYGQGYERSSVAKLNLDLEFTQKLDFITEGFSASVKGAYDNSFSLNKVRTGGSVEYQTVYYSSYYSSNGNMDQTDPDYDKTLVYVPTGSDSPLTYSETKGRGQNWYLEGRLNYDRSFGYHKVSGLLLYNQSRDYYPSTYTYIPRSYIGLVARATYSYNTKYMFDVNIGYNGSENFAPGKTRFGFFPAFSAGWVASAENFMKRQNVVTYLKFRASLGKVGSDVGTSTRFMYMPTVWNDTGGYSFGVSNPTLTSASQLGRLGNSDVTWETAIKQNYGMELKAVDSKISLDFDYFIEHRTGILISPNSTPGIIATALPNLNLGKVNNHGYEIQLGWNDNLGDVNYHIDANMSFVRNKIIDMDEVPKEYDYMNQTGGSTGRYTNLYKYLRLYQYSDFTKDADGNYVLNPGLPQPYQQVYPGDAMYADLNGDNIVDGNDKCVMGYGTRPEYTFGLNAGLTWKNFNFSMQWTGATNVNRMYDIEYRIPFTNAGKRGLLTYFYDGCWTPDNQRDAIYPRAAETSETWNSEASSLWLVDASYLRLKSLNIGYTLSNVAFLKKAGISSMGITLSGYNLLTFSPMKYLDPESVPGRLGEYPLVKIYSFGLNLNF